MAREKLTMADATRLQREHLNKWKSVLQDEVYRKLEAWATEGTMEAKEPLDVPRGQTLDEYIHNHLMKK